MSDSPFSAAARRMLVDAYMSAHAMGHSCLGSEHMVLALCMGGEERTSRILAGRGITAERIRMHLGAVGQEEGEGSPGALSNPTLLLPPVAKHPQLHPRARDQSMSEVAA